MEEFNKKTLIEALSSLPEHEPPSSLWKAIDSEMESGDETAYTQTQLHQLPTHEPPEQLWERIENKLAAKQARIIPLGARKWLATAASLALLLTAYWQLGNTLEPKPDDATVTYSVETTDDLLLKEDWNDDEAAFEEFKLLCEAKQYICEHPEFRSLKSELDELTEAKFALSEAIGEYGANADLIVQIKEIELERTDVLKKMMVMLI